MRPCQSLDVLETLRQYAPASLTRGGVALTRDDTQTTLDVYQCWLLLMIDLGYLAPQALHVTARKLWVDITHADVLDLNNACAECLDLVRRQTNKGFKALCSRISSHLHVLIKRDMTAIMQDDVLAAKRLIQLFSWTSRLSLKDIDLTQQMLEDYRRTEESIPSSYPTDLVACLNMILRQWLGSYVPFPIQPHHSGGAVAEMKREECCPRGKYKLLDTDALLEFAFGDSWWTEHNPNSGIQSRISRTIFVPKSYKTFRTISAEPATLQYFQQGVRQVLDDQINMSRYLRNRIGMHDQTRNSRKACEGSMRRNYATLDLSAASDSVSYLLVKQLFRGTWLYRFLICTRSTDTILPDGEQMQMRKFAPMGSALCFPVETLVFAAVCEKVTRDHRVFGNYTVFGDDIIVPTQCASEAIMLLETLGFTINRSKSFVDHECWFRESCGGEYCDGFDVTPIKVSRKYAARERDVRVTKLISLANRAYDAGYRHLRYFFVRKLRTEGYTPLFAPEHLHGDNYTNYHCEMRWNDDLQRSECRVTTLQTVRERLRQSDEEIRYRHWLESTATRKCAPREAFVSKIGFSTVTLKWSWLPKPICESDDLGDDK